MLPSPWRAQAAAQQHGHPGLGGSDRAGLGGGQSWGGVSQPGYGSYAGGACEQGQRMDPPTTTLQGAPEMCQPLPGAPLRCQLGATCGKHLPVGACTSHPLFHPNSLPQLRIPLLPNSLPGKRRVNRGATKSNIPGPTGELIRPCHWVLASPSLPVPKCHDLFPSCQAPPQRWLHFCGGNWPQCYRVQRALGS